MKNTIHLEETTKNQLRAIFLVIFFLALAWIACGAFNSTVYLYSITPGICYDEYTFHICASSTGVLNCADWRRQVGDTFPNSSALPLTSFPSHFDAYLEMTNLQEFSDYGKIMLCLRGTAENDSKVELEKIKKVLQYSVSFASEGEVQYNEGLDPNDKDSIINKCPSQINNTDYCNSLVLDVSSVNRSELAATIHVENATMLARLCAPPLSDVYSFQIAFVIPNIMGRTWLVMGFRWIIFLILVGFAVWCLREYFVRLRKKRYIRTATSSLVSEGAVGGVDSSSSSSGVGGGGEDNNNRDNNINNEKERLRIQFAKEGPPRILPEQIWAITGLIVTVISFNPILPLCTLGLIHGDSCRFFIQFIPDFCVLIQTTIVLLFLDSFVYPCTSHGVWMGREASTGLLSLSREISSFSTSRERKKAKFEFWKRELMIGLIEYLAIMTGADFLLLCCLWKSERSFCFGDDNGDFEDGPGGRRRGTSFKKNSTFSQQHPGDLSKKNSVPDASLEIDASAAAVAAAMIGGADVSNNSKSNKSKNGDLSNSSSSRNDSVVAATVAAAAAIGGGGGGGGRNSTRQKGEGIEMGGILNGRVYDVEDNSEETERKKLMEMSILPGARTQPSQIAFYVPKLLHFSAGIALLLAKYYTDKSFFWWIWAAQTGVRFIGCTVRAQRRLSGMSYFSNRFKQLSFRTFFLLLFSYFAGWVISFIIIAATSNIQNVNLTSLSSFALNVGPISLTVGFAVTAFIYLPPRNLDTSADVVDVLEKDQPLPPDGKSVKFCAETCFLALRSAMEVYFSPPQRSTREKNDRVLNVDHFGLQMCAFLTDSDKDTHALVAKCKMPRSFKRPEKKSNETNRLFGDTLPHYGSIRSSIARSSLSASSLPRKRIVVAFRGTASAKNVKHDLMASRIPLPLDVSLVGRLRPLVHTGFWASYENLSRGVMTALKALVEQAESEGFDTDVLITGHSLGGAMATLCALEVSMWLNTSRHSLCMYSFGQPRVGDRVFAAVYNQRVPASFRIVNAHDPVTRVPKFMFAFKHIGTEVLVGSAYFLFDPTFVEQAFRPAAAKPAAHKTGTYLRALRMNFPPEIHEFPSNIAMEAEVPPIFGASTLEEIRESLALTQRESTEEEVVNEMKERRRPSDEMRARRESLKQLAAAAVADEEEEEEEGGGNINNNNNDGDVETSLREIVVTGGGGGGVEEKEGRKSRNNSEGNTPRKRKEEKEGIKTALLSAERLEEQVPALSMASAAAILSPETEKEEEEENEEKKEEIVTTKAVEEQEETEEKQEMVAALATIAP